MESRYLLSSRLAAAWQYRPHPASLLWLLFEWPQQGHRVTVSLDFPFYKK